MVGVALAYSKISFVIIMLGSPTALFNKGGIHMDSNSLSHTKWNCKCHIVFAPKYRRKVAYGKIKQDIANILSMLCKRKGVKIVEAEICPDHVHMLVEIPPSMSVSYFVGYLKGKSTLMIFERHANLKYKYGNRHFLVSRILCRYSRKKCKEDTGIYSKSVTGRSGI